MVGLTAEVVVVVAADLGVLVVARREDDLELAAYLIVSAAEGAGINAGPEVFDERLAAELTSMFGRYLLSEPPGSDRRRIEATRANRRARRPRG